MKIGVAGLCTDNWQLVYTDRVVCCHSTYTEQVGCQSAYMYHLCPVHPQATLTGALPLQSFVSLQTLPLPLTPPCPSPRPGALGEELSYVWREEAIAAGPGD